MPPILLALILLAAPLDLHVAVTGRDTASGRADQPFATLEPARDAVRAIRGAGLTQPITITVHAGTYRLTEPLRFTPSDSGTETCPITWRAAPGEKVVITGSRPVVGWKPDAGGVFMADLAAQGIDDPRFRELFDRGERKVLARLPNLDPAHPVTGGLLYVEDTAPQPRNSFFYKPGSIPFEQWGELPQGEVNLFPYHCWDHNILRITAVDREAALVKLRYSVAGQIYVGNRYFIQNVRGALDAPGEWFSDYRTGKLYYLPPDGKQPLDGQVTVPLVEDLIVVAGTAEQPVEHLRFHGFTLTEAWQDGIALEGARQCQVTGCTVTHVGGVGINVGYLRNAKRGIGLPWAAAGAGRKPVHSGDRDLLFGYPCTACRAAGNDVSRVGGEGIALFGEGNVADNNHLSQTGTYDRVCAGLTMVGSRQVASHNNLHDVPRDGIFITGRENLAEYNDIRNSMLYTADNAAIALRQHSVAQAVVDRNNVLRFNRLLDTVGYGSYPHCTHPGDGFGSPFCSFGIYLDGSICGVTVFGNIVARCGGTSVFVQFGGGNTFENNIFVEDAAERIQFDSMIFFGTFMFPDGEGKYADKEPPNRFHHNIFAYGGPRTDLYRVGQWRSSPGWDKRQATFDDNLIWRPGLPVTTWLHDQLASKSLAEWQAAGFDTRSVTADPRFVDAAHDDYRLQPGSPAYQVGFKDINAELAKIGVYASEERASWPLQNAVLRREEPVQFAFVKKPLVVADGFELSPAGSQAGKAETAATGTGSAVVCEDNASLGRRSLRFIDSTDAKNPWEPHVYYRTDLNTGKVHLSVDLRNSPEAPADLYLECRDWRGAPQVGPTFRVAADGGFFVNGRFGGGGERIGEVPNGAWYTVTVEFALGEGAAQDYTVTVKVPGKPDLTATRSFVDAGFRNLTWFGISSLSAARTTFYVDNLVFGPAEAEQVTGALTLPALKGGAAPPVAPPPAPRADGLVGWWKFDDEGAELTDSSGNHLSGEAGGAGRAGGAFGKALWLEGGGSASVADSPLLHFGTDDLTFAMWLHPTMLAVPGSGVNNRRRVIAKEGWPATWWNVDLWGDGRVQMEMGDANGKSGTTVSEGRVLEQAWTHVAITVDRRNRQTSYYLNGKRDSVRALPADFTGALDVPGIALSTGNWQPFVGLLDELRIYRRALAAEDVARIFDETKAAYSPGVYRVIPDD